LPRPVQRRSADLEGRCRGKGRIRPVPPAGDDVGWPL